MACIDFTHLSPKNSSYGKRIVTVANGAEFVALDMTFDQIRSATGVIYLHVHRDSQRCYVGITIMAAADRWNAGIAYRNNPRFGSAIKRHGWAAFDSYILAFGEDRDALSSAEVAAITAAGGHKSRYTYNLSPGGDMVAENDKPLVGVHLPTGETRNFKSGADAARLLGMSNADMPMAVARGERTSVADWWFRFEDHVDEQPPKQWGAILRIASVRQRQGRRVIAISYETGETHLFDTTSAAAAALGIEQSAVSAIACGEALSAADWWFKYEGDERELPTLRGSQATRAKRDRKVFAVNLKTGVRREFRNCTVADSELGIYKGAAAGVASGERSSATDWWFTYDPKAEAPTEYKGALVAKARSKPVVAVGPDGIEQPFTSAKEAAAVLGISRSAICQVIGGKKHAAKGYRFRFG